VEDQKPFIDIRQVFKSKNPKLYRWLPNFVFNFVKKVVHEDDINSVMANIGHLHGMDFVNALIGEFGVEVTLTGAENIPLDRPVIFASNHPLGGMDGIAFMYALGKYRSDLRFLVNDILTNIKNFEPLFVPVNKLGSNSRDVSRLIEETYAGDYAVLVFPQVWFPENKKKASRIWNGKKVLSVSQKSTKRTLCLFISRGEIQISSITSPISESGSVSKQTLKCFICQEKCFPKGEKSCNPYRKTNSLQLF
jgi:hypothetical protein